DEDVIHHDRQRGPAQLEIGDQRQTQAEIELLGRSATQLVRDALAVAVRIEHQQPAAALVLLDAPIAAARHFTERSRRLGQYGRLTRRAKFFEALFDQTFGDSEHSPATHGGDQLTHQAVPFELEARHFRRLLQLLAPALRVAMARGSVEQALFEV